MKIFYYFITVSIFLSCIPLSFSNKLISLDYIPPVFEKISVLSESQLELKFNENCFVREDSISFSEKFSIKNIENNSAGKITISLNERSMPGVEYKIKISVKDLSGNTTSLITHFYGYNPDIPKLLINEIRVATSVAKPANIEIYVLSAGNLAGVTYYTGTKNCYKNFFIFPNLKVRQGDYIVVHLQPENIPEEKNETTGKNLSGGKEALSSAFDFWIEKDFGIFGSNGVVSLWTTKNGSLIDAILYSTRNSLSDTRYRGFGTEKTLTMITDIENENGWSSSPIKPEDCINPSNSTSTRTICRYKFKDTNSKEDWYICDSRECSIGDKNSLKIFK